MTSHQVQSYLNSFINFEKLAKRRKTFFTLDRIKELLNRLGDPQKELKIIHVAGSKGKGSTCAFISQILKEQGLRVGLYTSPHLYNFRERIRILDRKKRKTGELFGDEVSVKDLAHVLKDIKPVLESMRHSQFGQLTYFEVLTAVALYYFSKQKVDWVVLETGLGGRLDATNAADGNICVLTPMSLEHTDILGPTLKHIAKEKIAIVKPTTRCVIVSPQKAAVKSFMNEHFKKNRIKSFFIKDKDIKAYKRRGLLGAHQAVNAACAIKVVKSLRQDINQKAIQRGIKNAFWPGRFEVIHQKNRTYILDGAHNIDSAKALAAAFKEIFPHRKVLLILGMFKDKDHRGICRALNSIAEKIVLTRIKHERMADLSAQTIKKYFPNKEIIKTRDMKEALKISKSDIILITGSLYLVAEARKLLKD